MRQRVIVAALIEKDGHFLFIRQDKPGGAFPDTLHIPGGGVEPGEDPDDAIVREVQEETGVRMRDLRRHDFGSAIVEYKGETIQFVYLQYTGVWKEGVANPGSDAIETLWLSQAELATAKHNPLTLKLLSDRGLL